jgi:hypothetical protein
MPQLRFSRAINIARLLAELHAIPGTAVAIEHPQFPDGTSRSLISAAVDVDGGGVTIDCDDDMDPSALTAISTVVAAHDGTPDKIPPTPDFGDDVPDNYAFQLAQAVTNLRTYLNTASPTNAATVGALKLTIRVILYIARRQLI